jgi:hypothetical protein
MPIVLLDKPLEVKPDKQTNTAKGIDQVFKFPVMKKQ